MTMTADQLPDDPDALKAMVLARDVENACLIQIIKELQRHRFGRRAETLPEDQLLLGSKRPNRSRPQVTKSRQSATADRNTRALEGLRQALERRAGRICERA